MSNEVKRVNLATERNELHEYYVDKNEYESRSESELDSDPDLDSEISELDITNSKDDLLDEEDDGDDDDNQEDLIENSTENNQNAFEVNTDNNDISIIKDNSKQLNKNQEEEEEELKQNTSDNTNKPVTTTARLRTNRNSRRFNDKDRLDSIRFSMYAIQNSQLTEIDALLSELSQLQNTLDFPDLAYDKENELILNNDSSSASISPQEKYTPNNNQMNQNCSNSTSSFMTSSSSNSLNTNYYNKSSPVQPQQTYDTNNHSDDIEVIDQQFDEVLKFLAQSIDEHGSSPQLSSSSPSSMSLSATPNSDANYEPGNTNTIKKNDRTSGDSSNSSGIGDEFYSQESSISVASQFVNKKITASNIEINAQTHLKHAQQKSQHPVLVNSLQQHNNRKSSDSAFMDSMSIPSSISLGVIDASKQNHLKMNQNFSQSFIHPNGNANILEATSFSQAVSTNTINSKAESKAEQIRIALEKLKEANIKKLIVKAYTDDGCTKSVIVDETMKIYDVMLLLFTKNHSKPTVNYAIVEYLPKFNMERIFEDHENLVEAMSNWSRDSENQIIFTEKTEKYDLFSKPELYLMNEASLKKIDDSERNRLINEFFQNIGSPVPEIEGPLYIKSESKKSWKKHYCVLRQSGLYYIPKGKNKKDLQCLFNFDKLDLYYGIDWRKELKAPTDSCFALKYPQVQKKSSKYIKYICCENQNDLKRWFNGIRVAKFGKQLYENYKKILELIEISRLSGRIPLVNNRRLSASMSSQRPRSSYSLMTNVNNMTNNNDDQNMNNSESSQMIRSSVVTLDPSFNQNSNLKMSASLLIRRDSDQLIRQSQFNNDNMNSVSINGSQYSIQSKDEISHKPMASSCHRLKQPNLSYTDQLKTLLDTHKSQIEISKDTTNNNNENKSWQNILTPISVSTNLNNHSANQINNSKQTRANSPNKILAKIPVTTDLTKNLVQAQATVTAVSHQQHIVQKQQMPDVLISPNQFNAPASTSLEAVKEKPKPPERVLELETPVLTKQSSVIRNYEMKTNGNARNDLISRQTSNFEYLNENVYDLPSPPVELLHAQISHQAQIPDVIEAASLTSSMPSPSQNQINNINNNRNSKGAAPPVPPKPFKRPNSLNTENCMSETKEQINPSRLRKTSTDSTSENVSSNRMSNSSIKLNNNFANQEPNISSELSAILARQKKKIEDADAESENQRNSNGTKAARPASPTLVKKPPPPPRSDRSQLSRRFSNENNKININ